MSKKLPIPREDILLLRAGLICLVVSLAAAAGIYFWALYLNTSAADMVASEQARYEQTSTSVQQIAEEEATIIQYIGRYVRMQQTGIVGEEDRLQLLEMIASARVRNRLYPIDVKVSEQIATSLEYDPAEPAPGDPVDLRSSTIDLNLSLLHEADLSRLIEGLLSENSLLLPHTCEMKVSNTDTPDFSTLNENMLANCQLAWYTFDINPPVPVYEY